MAHQECHFVVAPPAVSPRHATALAVAGALVAVVALRFSLPGTAHPVLFLLVVPVAVAARRLGRPHGLATAAAGTVAGLLWFSLGGEAVPPDAPLVQAVVFLAVAVAAAPGRPRAAAPAPAGPAARDEAVVAELRGSLDALDRDVDDWRRANPVARSGPVRQVMVIVTARVLGLHVLLDRLEREGSSGRPPPPVAPPPPGSTRRR